MEKNKKKYNTFPKKNYLIGVLIIVFIILLGIYLFKWDQVKEDEKYLQSYLISSRTINLEMNDLNEIEDVLKEAPNNYLIYISYTESEKIYNFEKELKPVIDEYNLANNFYLLNITKIKKEEKNYQSLIAEKLNINEQELQELPVILIFNEDKELVSTIHTVNELKELLNTKDN